MRCEELKDLIPLATLGMLSPEEDALVREHLEAGCPVCAAEMAAMRETTSMISFALEPQTPSPMAKARLMAAVRAESERRGDRTVAPARADRRPAIAAALAASVLTAAITGYVMMARQQGIIDSSTSLIASLRAQIERQGEEVAK